MTRLRVGQLGSKIKTILEHLKLINKRFDIFKNVLEYSKVLPPPTEADPKIQTLTVLFQITHPFDLRNP
jgi:hypothetical protein